MNGLNKFDSKILYDIERGKNNIVINNIRYLIKYTISAFDDDKANNNLHLGVIPKRVILKIQNEITDVKKNKINNIIIGGKNYDLVINQREIRHLRKNNMTIDDVICLIKIIVLIVTSFDAVRYTLYKNSQNALRFSKKIEGDNFFLLLVVSNKKSMLRIHTIFLDKNNFKKRRLSPTLNERDAPWVHIYNGWSTCFLWLNNIIKNIICQIYYMHF